MTCRLSETLINKFEGEIECVVEGKEIVFSSAKELMNKTFEARYVVSKVFARNNRIVIELKEGNAIPEITEELREQLKENAENELTFF